MRRRALVSRLLAVLGIAIMTAAATPVLVPEVSQDRISIRGDFNGAQLLLFGAITYPAGTRNTDQADIVVVLKGPVESIVVREELDRFVDGLVDLNARGNLFKNLPNSVKITNSVLYQARINLPASVPVGDYTAETFLILDGRVEAAEVKEVTIEKIGMGRFITNLSQKNGFLYGLIAVFISVFLGWSAGYLFRKM